MTENLFLKVDNGSDKMKIVDAITTYLETNKKIEVFNETDTEPIATFTKYEVLRDGLNFNLDEAIPDYLIKRHNIMEKVELTEPIFDKENNLMKVSIKKFIA